MFRTPYRFSIVRMPYEGGRPRIGYRRSFLGWKGSVEYPHSLIAFPDHQIDGVVVWGLTRASCERRVQAEYDAFQEARE